MNEMGLMVHEDAGSSSALLPRPLKIFDSSKRTTSVHHRSVMYPSAAR